MSDARKPTYEQLSALCAQMAAALEEIKLASVTGPTADTPAMRTFDGVCRAIKELPGASMARDIYESHIDSIWSEADRALTAYRTLSPDPQWQRVPEIGDLDDRLIAYANDWRDRAGSNDVVLEAAAFLAALKPSGAK